MAIVIRETDPNIRSEANAHNQLKLQVGAGALFHLDVGEYAASTNFLANATDLPTLIALLNQCRLISITHRADSLIAKAADLTAPAAVAVDLATCITLANGLKADHNTHCASTAYHFTADAVNTIATANGTVLGDTITLANAIKTAYIAHMGSASCPVNASGSMMRVVSA